MGKSGEMDKCRSQTFTYKYFLEKKLTDQQNLWDIVKGLTYMTLESQKINVECLKKIW